MEPDVALSSTFHKEGRLYTEAEHVLFPSNEIGLESVVKQLRKDKLKGGAVLGVSGSGDTLLTLAKTIDATKVIGKDVNTKAIAFAQCLALIADSCANKDQYLQIILPELGKPKAKFLDRLSFGRAVPQPPVDRPAFISKIIENNNLSLSYDEFEAIRGAGISSGQGEPQFSKHLTYFVQLIEEKNVWLSQDEGISFVHKLLDDGAFSLYEGAIEDTSLEEIQNIVLDDEKISIIYLSNVDVHIGKVPLVKMIARLQPLCTEKTKIVYVEGNRLQTASVERFLDTFSLFYTRD
jgi:hypothetical protein